MRRPCTRSDAFSSSAFCWLMALAFLQVSTVDIPQTTTNVFIGKSSHLSKSPVEPRILNYPICKNFISQASGTSCSIMVCMLPVMTQGHSVRAFVRQKRHHEGVSCKCSTVPHNRWNKVVNLEPLSCVGLRAPVS